MASSNREKRKERRFHYETAIALGSSEGGLTSFARMYNVSEGGVYFESDTRIAKRKQMYIWIANSPFARDPGVYESQRVKVLWRTALEDSVYAYGYGAKRLDPAETFAESMVISRLDTPQPRVGNLRPIKDSRRHPRKPVSMSVYFGSQDGHHKGLIRNISRSGLFIETRSRFQVGHPIQIAIPDDRFDRYLSITGRVVHSGSGGIGLKVTRVARRKSP